MFVIFLFYSCKLLFLTFKSKHTHDFMILITALFNQKHSLNVICVFYLHFIRSRPTVPPTELKLFKAIIGRFRYRSDNIVHP